VCGSREIKSKARQQQDVSRIGNKTDAHRVLAEKDEGGGAALETPLGTILEIQA